MKALLLTAAMACFCLSASAQEWSGTPTAPVKLSNLPSGVDISISNGASWDPSHVRPLSTVCYDAMGKVSQPPCTTGTSLHYVEFRLNAEGQREWPPFPQIEGIPVAAVASDSLVSIQLSGDYRDPSAPSGVSQLEARIPLTAFASAARMLELAESTKMGIALASSLNLSNPINGKTNRIALGMGTYEDKTAVSINYSKQIGDFDLGFAAAVSGSESLGKAGLGFSW